MFGRIVRGTAFIDRKSELKQLSANLIAGMNTVVVAPRRWGKTSLVLNAAEHVSSSRKKLRICYIDLNPIQNDYHFLESFALEVIKASSNNWQDWVQIANELLKGFLLSVSTGTDPGKDFRLMVNWEDSKKAEKAVLDLPEKIAGQHKIKFILCIDGFHKILEFHTGQSFHERILTHWKDRRKTTYCLIGNRGTLTASLFASKDHPINDFGEMIFLQTIKQKHWVGHIKTQFAATGKYIDRETISYILKLAADHPYHVQQLTHNVWRFTEEQANPETVDLALEEIMLHNDLLFRREIENLTPLQLNYLAAILNGESHLNSMKTIHHYRLVSPGNLSTLKLAMEHKEILDFHESQPKFINPFFEQWLHQSNSFSSSERFISS